MITRNIIENKKDDREGFRALAPPPLFEVRYCLESCGERATKKKIKFNKTENTKIKLRHATTTTATNPERSECGAETLRAVSMRRKPESSRRRWLFVRTIRTRNVAVIVTFSLLYCVFTVREQQKRQRLTGRLSAHPSSLTRTGTPAPATRPDFIGAPVPVLPFSSGSFKVFDTENHETATRKGGVFGIF